MDDRIVVSYNGEIQQIGTPSELYEKPDNKFVAGFIGTPTINMYEGKLKNEELVIGMGAISLTSEQVSHLMEHLTSEKVLVGIRPEAITLFPTDSASNVFSASIDVLEPLGSITHIYARTSDNSLVTTTVNGIYNGKIKDEIKFTFDRTKIHIFGGETEKNLLNGL